MRRAAIVMPMRTPVGLPGGALAAVSPQRLIATVLTAVVGRSGIDPHRIEHLVTAVPAADVVRPAAQLAGFSPVVGEFAVGVESGGGLRALVTAAMMVQTGAADVVVALGAEFPAPPAAPGSGAAPGGSGAAARESLLKQAEDLAQHFGLTRAEVDEFAADSHRRAARARRQGLFGGETAPVVVCADPDDVNSDVLQLVDRDEGLRDDVSARAFAELLPLLPGGISTEANCGAPTLAAAGCLVVAEERLADLGLEPMGYLVGWATATPEPGVTVPAATSAVAKALWRTGFELGEVDLLEVDESTAAEALAAIRSLGVADPDGERLNVHGGAVALGDPGGAAGLRVVTTLLHELTRRAGGSALAVSPAGPAQALAVVFESPTAVPIAPTPRGARFHGGRARRSGRHRA
ncbi:acetyl-CoA acetyltransferase [Nocardia inohanensis]|uniref:thiolase family protein n=1 Tax=Nocardia inohanensis TaxID=209246 RepID=UPI001FE139CB|nr:acetyl-CoA acetyltransferase [Nocardia inohanensis]